ncbi:hypothetical protein CLOM_g1486 [Closterium sp. NIES-68]|nr:hypothetical protein CLOM_g1486 [Closterium sp. NIES-68]GJP59681.1 hypothetical protein CLOP_g14720 [Closterium sp. NIES-67]
MASRIPPPSSPLRHLPFPPTSPRRPTSKTAPPAPPRVEQRKSGGRAEHPLHGRARNLESAVGEAGEAGRMAGGVVTAAPNHRGYVVQTRPIWR